MAVEKLQKRVKKAPKDVAIICGVTGLVGKQLLEKLLSRSKWKVYGVARRSETKKPNTNTNTNPNPNYHFISCNLLDPFETKFKLSNLHDLTHVFWVTWASQFALDSIECYEQNKAMMSNALDSILPGARGLKHFSLQTGTKHYVSLNGGSFDNLVKKVCYYDENCPRVETQGFNFYYGLEDLLKDRLAGAIPWSVHRPGLIIGSSQKTVYNFMGSLCVYGTICKYLNLPFVFGGRKECWEEQFIDVSDARLVAEQQIWAAKSYVVQSKDGQALNSINGDGSTWKEIWAAIGKKFGVMVPFETLSEDFTYAGFMSDKGSVWKEIVKKEGLVETEMEDLANWYFLDALFRCPVKMLGTREKVDGLGFTKRYHALDSISHWINVMRKEKLIP